MSEDLCKKARNNLAEFGDSVEILNDRIENGLKKPDGWFDTIIWLILERMCELLRDNNDIRSLLHKKITAIRQDNIFLRYKI